MDRTRAIDRLAGPLQDAGARADWELLGRAVRELGPQLQQLAAAGAWNGPELAALARLRGAHDAAAQAVATASVQLHAHMDDMLANKEGWMAYALAVEPEPDMTQR